MRCSRFQLASLETCVPVRTGYMRTLTSDFTFCSVFFGGCTICFSCDIYVRHFRIVLLSSWVYSSTPAKTVVCPVITGLIMRIYVIQQRRRQQQQQEQEQEQEQQQQGSVVGKRGGNGGGGGQSRRYGNGSVKRKGSAR